MPNPTTSSEAIAGRLLAEDATVLAALIDTRVFPSKPTQEPTGDYVVYYRNGGGDGVTLNGTPRLKAYEIRVECVGETQARAEAILKAVDARLDGWRDRDIGVQGCFAVGDSDESTLEDGRQVSGQTYKLMFKPQQ